MKVNTVLVVKCAYIQSIFIIIYFFLIMIGFLSWNVHSSCIFCIWISPQNETYIWFFLLCYALFWYLKNTAGTALIPRSTVSQKVSHPKGAFSLLPGKKGVIPSMWQPKLLQSLSLDPRMFQFPGKAVPPWQVQNKARNAYNKPASLTKNLTLADINHCVLSHAIFTLLSTAGAKVAWVHLFLCILLPLFHFHSLSDIPLHLHSPWKKLWGGR